MRAIGVPHVTVIRPYKVKKSIEAIREALALQRRVRDHLPGDVHPVCQGPQAAKQRPFYVSDKCKNHRNCINDLGCPAFFIEKERIRIDADMCVGCAVCAQICPENAILPLKDGKTAA